MVFPSTGGGVPLGAVLRPSPRRTLSTVCRPCAGSWGGRREGGLSSPAAEAVSRGLDARPTEARADRTSINHAESGRCGAAQPGTGAAEKSRPRGPQQRGQPAQDQGWRPRPGGEARVGDRASHPERCAQPGRGLQAKSPCLSTLAVRNRTHPGCGGHSGRSSQGHQAHGQHVPALHLTSLPASALLPSGPHFAPAHHPSVLTPSFISPPCASHTDLPDAPPARRLFPASGPLRMLFLCLGCCSLGLGLAARPQPPGATPLLSSLLAPRGPPLPIRLSPWKGLVTWASSPPPVSSPD